MIQQTDNTAQLQDIVAVLSSDPRVESIHQMTLNGSTRLIVYSSQPMQDVLSAERVEVSFVWGQAVPPSSFNKIYEKKKPTGD